MIKINGRNISEHPYPNQERIYHKIGTVLAVEAPVDGEVETPEGVMRFVAGDFIVTDNPPTHAWPVARAVFLRTYEEVF